MTTKSKKYFECDTMMDGYNNAVPPPLPNRVPQMRNIYAEPYETTTLRWVLIYRTIFLRNISGDNPQTPPSHYTGKHHDNIFLKCSSKTSTFLAPREKAFWSFFPLVGNSEKLNPCQKFFLCQNCKKSEVRTQFNA